MDPERWQKISELFQAAIAREDDERVEYLNSACGDDTVLRQELEALVVAHKRGGGLIDGGAAEFGAPMLVGDMIDLTGRTLGNYKVIRKLGSGGMGEVYLARDEKLQRFAALKVLLPGVAFADTVSRFEQEARAASALNHPNILTVHDIDTIDGIHYLATEYIEGETLRDKLARGPLPLNEAIEIAQQAAAALAAAHEANIIHRDIKPENIMARSNGLVKVLDFGLAKLTGGITNGPDAATMAKIKTAPGLIMGTIAYMSPEQARALDLDARTDIWSLGVVLYEMITGEAPFAGRTITDTLVSIMEKQLPPLSAVVSDIPADVDRIADKALRKNVDERYGSASELLADLKQVQRKIESGPVRSKATDDVRRNSPAVDRSPSSRFWARTGIIAAAVLILSMATALYLWRRSATTADADTVHSLAVLPLRSLDAGENYLGLGIADAVIRRISQTGEMIVRPTSSVRKYLDPATDALSAARELNAEAVLDGSLQRADDRVRVSINLLRTSDGRSLGTDQFDLQATDSFTLQDLIAERVASRLSLQLDPAQQARLTKRGTSNPEAYDLYLKGVYELDQRITGGKAGALTTIDLFKRSIEADPNFALAHAQLSNTYAMMGVFVEPTEARWADLARQESERANSLDPQLAETHIARFSLLFSQFEGYDAEAAIREVHLAQQLDPNVGHPELAYLYSHLGLEDLASRELARAAEIDPTSEYVKQLTLDQYALSARYDEWFTAAQRAAKTDKSMETIYYLAKGRVADAQRTIEQIQASIASGTAAPLDEKELANRTAVLFALKGDKPGAEKEINKMLASHPVKDPTYHHAAYDIACVYAIEGRSAEAVKWLREAADTGFQPYGAYSREPLFDGIRRTDEFRSFLAEMRTLYEKHLREFGPAA